MTFGCYNKFGKCISNHRLADYHLEVYQRLERRLKLLLVKLLTIKTQPKTNSSLDPRGQTVSNHWQTLKLRMDKNLYLLVLL